MNMDFLELAAKRYSVRNLKEIPISRQKSLIAVLTIAEEKVLLLKLQQE